MNRLELGRPAQAPGDRYKKIIGDEQKIDRLLVDLFLQSHDTPPEEISLDVDVTDDSDLIELIQGHFNLFYSRSVESYPN